MKTYSAIFAASLFLSFACATAGPSPELLDARAAYQTAASGPAKDLNPADLHEADVLLGQAENASASGDVALTRQRAYLAQRRAELADAQGKTSQAMIEKQQALAKVQALRDQQLSNAKGQLAQANAAQAQTQSELAQSQAQLGAEHASRVEMHGQLAQASEEQARTQNQLAQADATQAQTQAQLAQTQDQLGTEHQARLNAEQDTANALGKIAAMKQEARGLVLTLSGSVSFTSGRSELLPIAKQRLDEVAGALRSSGRTILIEGHTDSRGSEVTNQRLSQGRAQAVLDYLVSRGVKPDRVRAVGLGASRPIADNSSSEGRANNRRVEVVIEPPTNLN